MKSELSIFYNHATNMDYAFIDKNQLVQGNSYIVNVEFTGTSTDEGILFDFSLVKKKVKQIIDRDCDHCLVVPEGITVFENGRALVKIGEIEYRCPKEAVCEIPYKEVSREALTSFLEDRVMAEMPDNIQSVNIGLQLEKGIDETLVYFNYTHGLKEHTGNCQRLFHGHRSAVKVFVKEERRADLEDYLVKEVLSGVVHFCWWDNIVNKSEIQKGPGGDGVEIEGRHKEISCVHIKYTSCQGVFEAYLPGRMVYMLKNDTTAENVSIHFAKIIKKELREDTPVTVHAFEGIGKGAIIKLS